MIIHSPIVSGSLTFANGATITLPVGSVYSGSFSGSYQGASFIGGTFSGNGSSLTFGGTGIVSGSSQLTTDFDARYLNTGGDGIVSSSAQVKTLLPAGTISGSSQVVGSSITTNTITIGSTSTALGGTSTTLAGLSSVTSTTFVGALTGNASTATTLQTARTINGTSFNGSANITIPNLVSGSSQVDADTITNFDSNVLAYNNSLGVISGSSQVVGILSSLNTYTGSNDTTNTAQNGRLTSLETASGSAITRLTTLESETSNLESFTSSIDTTIKTKLNVEGVISGSSQILAGSGLFSGSSQVNADTITNFDANVLAYNNSLAVVSGSASSVKTFLSLGNVTNESKATMFTSPTFTGTVSGVTATHVGLGNVTNESKSTMFTSPTFTGTPIAPTAASNTNSTQIATTAYVQQELTDLIGGASAAFDTLLEISASLASGDSTLNTLVDGKLAKASNLSDLTDASTARTNLGLVIGTNVQAYNSTLASVAGGTYSGDDSITTIGTVTAGNVTAILPAGTITGSSQVFSNVSGDVTIASNGVATIAANSVALGTDTTGNYVASLVAGTNITLSNNSGEGATPTIGLTNNTISGIALGSNLATLTIGTGLSGTSYNGSTGITIANTGVLSITSNTGLSSNVSATGAVTITNTGVTSNVAGTGISVSGATGAVTITNTGVTSAVAGTGVGVSAGTGAVTISIGQAVATSSNVQFNSLGIGMAASATAGRIDATNDIVAYSSSDIRFKENIIPIQNPLEKISKISGNTYDWKEENKIEHGYEGNDVGVIAQEIEEVLPQLVQTRENGYKAVKYDKLVALLIEGIKEQQSQIEELRNKIEKLENGK